ncbi:Tol-Pal system subunit TolQ [Candidatus Trichorickettsia mobilis]|uniref:Tol-Pal system subunit TolQ n=1 Tax=Candidatus Trichorickettsia mobilis TaxID=1346319 RepID=A0ABZ0UTE3_9RICK|nr:protein TolQ [Candidatus Trichorickettsia mobilis]WPY01305.1 Tol-Pal system subunit TolQ [Candidatus Trichorickettsia mobilis]
MSTITVNEVANITVSNNSSIFSLIASADLVSKSVMLLLIIVSIWSWTIIFDKTLRLTKIKKKIAAFESVFWSGQILDQLYENIKNAVDNPLAAIFVGAMHECKRGNRKNQTDSFLKIGQKERILQSMHLIRDRELEKLETNLTFLATVGSSATFIGLFGTVWGIMHSFQSIAASKNTSLAVVAPGIAEALLATAIGLLAAIPAVIFHSYLMNKVISINNKMDDFVGELNTLLSRAIDEEKI